MPESSLLYRSATELAALIRGGHVSSLQVVEAHLRQIADWNGQINAMVSVRAEEALQEAVQADRAVREGRPLPPLHGVPLTLKDSLRVRDVPSTFGVVPTSMAMRPTSDCVLAARLRQSGAILLGRTNLPLAALDWQCNNLVLEECVNPWDPHRTPGGSSGGAAAALAAGFTPLEVGSDLGGSIRYPAHCCGVLGLRTSVGILPIADIGPEGIDNTLQRQLSVGPMARTIDDLTLLFDILTDAGSPPATTSPATAEPQRIAVTMGLPGAMPSTATQALMSSLCDGLRADGHTVDTGARPDVDLDEAWRLWGILAGYQYWSGLPPALNTAVSRFLFQSYMLRYKLGDGPFTACFSAGMVASRAQYEAALARQTQICTTVDAFLQQYAMWILPVSMGEAIVRQRRGSPIDVDGEPVPYSVYLGAYTVPTTLFETPVLTAPIGLAPSGMPVGVQIHGARFSDRRLLQTAQRVLGKYLHVRMPPAMARRPQ